MFKAKFRRTLISTQDAFIYYLQYIHHNPIHHNFTFDYANWEYSSYAVYSEGDGVNVEGISTTPVFRLFKTENDQSGRQGFVVSHQNFKDFSGRE